MCVEPGAGDKLMPTSMTEEYGIPYLDPDGSLRESYCGTNIVAHEFFHTIHGAFLKQMDPVGYLMIEHAAARAVTEGIYAHHPGAADDGCNPDMIECVAYEFIVKAHMTWNGFPADPREFRFRSRADIKREAPWIAVLVHRFFEDGDWNPAHGARIDAPRDQTFNLSCATAPGSALCGEALSSEDTGPPMRELLRNDSWRERAGLPPAAVLV